MAFLLDCYIVEESICLLLYEVRKETEHILQDTVRPKQETADKSQDKRTHQTYFTCMVFSLACMSVHLLHTCCLQRPDKGIGSSGSEVTDGS